MLYSVLTLVRGCWVFSGALIVRHCLYWQVYSIGKLRIALLAISKALLALARLASLLSKQVDKMSLSERSRFNQNVFQHIIDTYINLNAASSASYIKIMSFEKKLSLYSFFKPYYPFYNKIYNGIAFTILLT